ncbi:MAG: hypothetical protein LQ352_007932 [Teloschistes flavicans]|nr:MAG: hypothetical protein LQ352_007932 [Teloschistes flavicans]
MATMRRNRTMPTDAACSKFLYTIMKQLDLKSIDWNAVADELEITNGHAARMRYSRFKQQMEGVVPQARKPRTPKKKDASDDAPKPKKRKRAQQTQSEKDNVPKDEIAPVNGVQDTAPTVKAAPAIKSEPMAPLIKSEPVVKEEPGEQSIASFPLAPPNPISPSLTNATANTTQWLATEPATIAPQELFFPSKVATPAPEAQMSSMTSHPVKQEPTVKMEMEA